jgi:hypothetical protein
METAIDNLHLAMNELLKIREKDIRILEFSRITNCRTFIGIALERLQAAPRWETPEQYKERTGKDWPDEAAVYYYYTGFGNNWGVCRYITAKEYNDLCVCATEAGPPPADWKPEGDRK